MSAHAVEFYFDYNSPYSYIASHLIEDVCARHDATVRWQPFVLGAAFQAAGITPAHTNEARARYLFQDLQDLAEIHGIPYRSRTQFLFKPVLSLRATLQVPQGPERAKAVHALFAGAFARDLDLGAPEVVAGLLDEAGLDGQALVQGTEAQEVKDALKEQTDRAIARGVFGAPTFIVDNDKLIWGHDRLHVLEHHLNKADAA